MRYAYLHVAFLLVLGCAAGTTLGQEKIKPQVVSGKIEWIYDYAAGQELARQTGKPLFVVFRCER